MTVAMTLAADSDPEAVEKCFTDEMTRAVAEVEEVRGGKPVVRLADVTDVGQVWHCIVVAKDVDAQAPAGHEVRKRLLERLRREKIALAVRERVFLQPEKTMPRA
jgi:small-conductance mechanosensitive channel